MLIFPYVIWKKKQRHKISLAENIKDFHKLNVSRIKINIFNKMFKIDRNLIVWRILNKLIKFVDRNKI